MLKRIMLESEAAAAGGSTCEWSGEIVVSILIDLPCTIMCEREKLYIISSHLGLIWCLALRARIPVCVHTPFVDCGIAPV